MDFEGPADWQAVSLAELGEVNRGRSRHRPRHAEHLYGGPYPFIQTGDIKSSGGRISSYTQTYSDAGLAQSRLWPTGTMCITIAANIAETAILAFPACFPDSVVGFIADPSKADVRFVEFMFRQMRRAIQHQATGSVQDNINLETLGRLRFPIPPLPEQKRIAHILGTLDDKIELNRRMNATMEGISRAIFKSWFVDFDPVRRKAAGQQPVGMDAQTAALFPDSFEDSEIGEVPKGWCEGCLGDIAETIRRSVRPDEIAPDTPYIALEHMPRRSIALSEWDSAAALESNKSQFQRGEILFGKLRPYFHKVGVAPLDGVCSTDIVVVRPKSPQCFGYVLGHMSSDAFVAYANAGSTGTKMPRTNWEDMAKYGVVIPPDEITRAFDFVVKDATNSMASRIFQSRTLAALRDTLLPKLLSGEIRVPEAAQAVEEALT
jgi:type I restriction enzyme S subunit